MEAEAAKFIGAGIAAIGMGGAAIGVANIFGNFLSAAIRNPAAAPGQFTNLIFGFAVTRRSASSFLIAPPSCSRSSGKRGPGRTSRWQPPATH
jgi:F-type H+-transporting ATPase subunit c